MLSASEGGILTLYLLWVVSGFVVAQTLVFHNLSWARILFFMDKICIFAVAAFCRSELAVPESV